MLIRLLAIALLVAGCGGGSPTASNGASPTAPPISTIGPTTKPVTPPTVTPTAVDPDEIAHIVEFLDLLADTQSDKIFTVVTDEAEWLTKNVDPGVILANAEVAAYFGEFTAVLTDVTTGAGPTSDLAELLAFRDELAGLVPGGVATPAPTPTPVPTPTSYVRLTSRAWAKLLKAPDNNIGNGYKLWGCISQFDAATGVDTFRAQASYRNEEYWFTDGVNVFFNGDEDQLADFVQGDVVAMSVVSLGSYSYDTQAGGNTTVPLFQVDKIQLLKGTC